MKPEVSVSVDVSLLVVAIWLHRMTHPADQES